MNETPTQIQFVLISHTNAGKTTLVRTLTEIDVGEVRDGSHVTTHSESHILLESAVGDVLQLWDTPGFGDSTRLFKRLAKSDNPIGWFLREVVDRIGDRTFWLSQQAVRTARQEADVVLYLVNSSEDPRDAGYLASEMKILQWLGKPVVILLNQTGLPHPSSDEQAEQARWRNHLDDYSVVRKVLPLDAFARCWVHERVFYETVGDLIPVAKKDAYVRLFLVWEQERERRFDAAMELLATQVLNATRDSEKIEEGDGLAMDILMSVLGQREKRDQKFKQKAMTQLISRLSESTQTTTLDLLKLYRLDVGSVDKISQLVNEAFVLREPIDKVQAGLFGAVITGAAGGLKADILTGGLSHGVGTVIGAIVGAITFAGAAWGFNASTDRDKLGVRFSDDFIRSLLVASLLRYLAVTHFGRGRGKFVEEVAPGFWHKEVKEALASNEAAVADAVRLTRTESDKDKAKILLIAVLKQASTRVFNALYPKQMFQIRPD